MPPDRFPVPLAGTPLAGTPLRLLLPALERRPLLVPAARPGGPAWRVSAARGVLIGTRLRPTVRSAAATR